MSIDLDLLDDFRAKAHSAVKPPANIQKGDP
jgi:hypothetical protein